MTRSNRIGVRLAMTLWLAAATGWAQQQMVAGTVHNLSASGPGTIRAVSESEVCKFCHIPHSAPVAQPLWGHALSQQGYATPVVGRSRGVATPVPQPDGSSRLCLSCHDGSVALGDVAGEPQPIAMRSAERLAQGHRGFLGTDLSGSHAVSFVVGATPSGVSSELDMGVRSLAAIQADPDVQLDEMGKMQCTTCHDPHDDGNYRPGETPHFWVKPAVGDVCLTCHTVR